MMPCLPTCDEAGQRQGSARHAAANAACQSTHFPVQGIVTALKVCEQRHTAVQVGDFFCRDGLEPGVFERAARRRRASGKCIVAQAAAAARKNTRLLSA